MPTEDISKKFEDRFQKDWEKTFPDGICQRLPDQMTGYKETSKNPSDFICYNYPYLYFCEIKTHKGASIPFDAIPQYERLLELQGIHGVRLGVICWLREKDVVFYVPVSTLKQLKDLGEKSVGIRHFDKYNIKIVPSEKKKVFMYSDYSFMTDLQDGE